MSKEKPSNIAIYVHHEPLEIDTLPKHPEHYWAEPNLDGLRSFLTIMHQEPIVMITTTAAERKDNQGLDITQKFPEIVAGGSVLSSTHSLVLDGKIIYKKGKTLEEGAIVQKRHSVSEESNQFAWYLYPCIFAAFDILFIDGTDISQLPYEERKKKLFELFDEETQKKTGIVVIPTIPYIKEYTQALKEQGFEGVVYKLKKSLYPFAPTDKSNPWLKRTFRIKSNQQPDTSQPQ